MSDKDFLLDEIYIDAISEVLNIAMGAAAATLSEMTSEEVELNIPNIKFINRFEATQIIEGKANSSVSGTHQHFNGIFNGDALLLFPEQQSLELVRAVLKEDMALEELSDIKQEAMTEIGNIILNACLCSMADMFGEEMKGQLPKYIQGTLENIFSNDGTGNTETVVLLLNMEFSLDKKDIQGYVIFLMGIESVLKFKKLIALFIG